MSARCWRWCRTFPGISQADYWRRLFCSEKQTIAWKPAGSAARVKMQYRLIQQRSRTVKQGREKLIKILFYRRMSCLWWRMTSAYKFLISIIAKLWFRPFLGNVFHSYVIMALRVIQTRVMAAQTDTELYTDTIQFNVHSNFFFPHQRLHAETST